MITILLDLLIIMGGGLIAAVVITGAIDYWALWRWQRRHNRRWPMATKKKD